MADAAATQSANLGDAEGQWRLADLAGRMAATGTDFDRQTLEGLADELWALMEERFDLVSPDLDGEDWKSLTRYLDGNRLLLECLDQSVVADREAIKERLLLLPEE